MPFSGFSDATDAEVTNAIAEPWSEECLDFTDTEVIVGGGGPSGLVRAGLSTATTHGLDELGTSAPGVELPGDTPASADD